MPESQADRFISSAPQIPPNLLGGQYAAAHQSQGDVEQGDGEDGYYREQRVDSQLQSQHCALGFGVFTSSHR